VTQEWNVRQIAGRELDKGTLCCDEVCPLLIKDARDEIDVKVLSLGDEFPPLFSGQLQFFEPLELRVVLVAGERKRRFIPLDQRLGTVGLELDGVCASFVGRADVLFCLLHVTTVVPADLGDDIWRLSWEYLVGHCYQSPLYAASALATVRSNSLSISTLDSSACTTARMSSPSAKSAPSHSSNSSVFRT